MMACFSSATLVKTPRRMRLLGDLGKEALDHVEPRGRSRREVQVKARMPLEPAFTAGVLVGGIVVDDQMQVESLAVVASMISRNRRNS